MPTYDFRCSSCETVFEAFRSFAQGTDDVVCPDDAQPATRLLSLPLDMIVKGGKSSRSSEPVKPPGAAPSPGHSHGPGGHSHGHSHGPGSAPHSH